MITHMVLFQFRNQDDAQQAQDRLRAMRGKIPSLRSLEAGLDFTRSARSFDLGLITKHDTRQDLDAYRVHPVHQEVVAFIKPRATASAAVDFED